VEAEASLELLKVASGFGLVGIVAVVLGLKFMKSSENRENRMQAMADEDRKWRNENGEKQIVLLSQFADALKTSTDTNAKLAAALVEKAK
jgi:hypothetical protein